MVVGAGVGGDEDVAGEGGDGLEDGRQRVPPRQWHRGGGRGLECAWRPGQAQLRERRWVDGWMGWGAVPVREATPAEAGVRSRGATEEGSTVKSVEKNQCVPYYFFFQIGGRDPVDLMRKAVGWMGRVAPQNPVGCTPARQRSYGGPCRGLVSSLPNFGDRIRGLEEKSCARSRIHMAGYRGALESHERIQSLLAKITPKLV